MKWHPHTPDAVRDAEKDRDFLTTSEERGEAIPRLRWYHLASVTVIVFIALWLIFFV